MKKVRTDETMILTMNEINTLMIDIALKVDKLKKCV
jgi:hypothetical protein